jgi:tetratricopeptide (TPR) repeat protein
LTTISIPLADLVLDPEGNLGFSGLTDDALAAELQPYYTFLGPDARVTVEDDTLTITMPDVSSHQEDRARRSYERAVKSAERGNYNRAIPAFEEALNNGPLYAGARRNLAMAYLESGDTATAVRLLVETLRLDPKDTWAYLLLGNISMRQDHNTERAERLYEKAVALSPDDHIVITNYAALLAERGETEKADGYFLKAIQIEPSYPNSYYALAKMARDVGDVQRAINVLDNMFDIASGPTVRNQAFFAEAQGL